MKAINFEKPGVVSVWLSAESFAKVSGSYFDDDCWQKNFKIAEYDPELMELNGVEQGLASVDRVVGQCSYSNDFVDAVVAKARKLGIDKVGWVVLQYDFEYRPKKTGVQRDEVLRYLGNFPYDLNANSRYPVAE